MQIRWVLPTWLLILLLLFILSLPGVAVFWFLAKFDLPFFHGGDVMPVYFIGFFYWLVWTIFIFGFKLDEATFKDERKSDNTAYFPQ